MGARGTSDGASLYCFGFGSVAESPGFGSQEEAALLERIWAEEQAFLEPDLIKSRGLLCWMWRTGLFIFGKSPVSTGNFL